MFGIYNHILKKETLCNYRDIEMSVPGVRFSKYDASDDTAMSGFLERYYAPVQKASVY